MSIGTLGSETSTVMPATVPVASRDSGESRLARGPEELNQFVASRLEPAIGSEIPQLEVRYKNLSVSADINDCVDVRLGSHGKIQYSRTNGCSNLPSATSSKQKPLGHINVCLDRRALE
ncbi:unnamed protein product [Phytophthora fragariaefolia]|uniref:Unnamed protein product n=1 Tax=Phytophthora fragariaefolia TaxID=1490495 RepID=A0A9W6X1M8_9STRA|nr:unnamed protein product [Phytophthora fragariaefolia]